ncbi:NACHT domain- and WD repeat-containing protein 1 [Haematobia irritans]|uniref:NACHT domain- and WD repeat-containing protein 1 n=1 Tax=Haematobia irritans TaxID=7368 RepID=UPI003F4F7795
MGNVCSSGQSTKKDSVSEKSDDSYVIQTDGNAQEFGEQKTAPLADPEPVQDVEHTNTSSAKEMDKAENTTSTTYKKQQDDPTTAVFDASAKKEIKNAQHSISYMTMLQGAPRFVRNTDRNKKIVLYVLSDNSEVYRKYLHVVYSLQKQFTMKCHTKNFEFLISNVHNVEGSSIGNNYLLTQSSKWTHTPLEAQGGHEEAENCLSEITRHSSTAYIIPLLFLGTTLGATMLPLTIESQDFAQVLSTANEEDKTLLERWYIIDNCYQPMCHRLNTELCTKPDSTLDDELNKLFEVLLRLFSDDLKDSYMSTIVEQEINNTVFMSQELAKRCIWIHTAGNVLTNSLDEKSVYVRETNRRMSKLHSELKAHLSEKNVIRIVPSMGISDDELKTVLENLIEKSIDCVFEEHCGKNNISNNTNGTDHVLLEEIELICHYSKTLAQNSPNFEIMTDIKRYIKDNAMYPLIISGPTGCGKSVLVSKISEHIFKWNSEMNLILRYSNLTARSYDLTSMLGSIANQLAILSYGKQMKVNHTIESYTEIIHKIVSSRKCSFVIVIDSIDDIRDAENIDWIPVNLNGICKIILTLTENNDVESCIINKLEAKGIPKKYFLKMKQYSTRQWQDILSTGGGDFYSANSAIKMPQEWKLLNGSTPFHAKSFWWLAWLGHNSVTMTDITETLDKILQVIESKFPNDYAEILLLILAVSQWGFRESHCIEIFQRITNTDSYTAYRQWSKFCWLMGPMIINIRSLKIMDKSLRNAILAKYRYKHAQIHRIIREFYDRQDSYISQAKHSSQIYNIEKYKKLPYHQFCCIMEDPASKNKVEQLFHSVYFTELHWMANKVEAAGVAYLINDILLCENFGNVGEQPYIHIKVLKDFLCEYIFELTYDGHQFYTLINFNLKYRIRKDPSLKANQIIRSWLESINELEIPFLDIINKSFDDELSSDGQKFNALVNLPHPGFFIASISTDQGEICVWDVRKCTRVRVLQGITQPTALCPFGTYNAAVLCRREIKVINLDNGKFKVTLKGVMNQKMPYFGLHDQEHLVCLSRNRMYVNLMNLDSGDCITTFKAGEDRFLNSLLVSGDGRILVCGDETQKPFPLLVWHLSQRKLLYDLRIPHHDFITTLSAITHEGSYVCVVAKELNEPTPNFIVVYDLQSGTLFKKWKPACDTTSLAISQTNACVIAGLEDAKILVWDLVTGNCRATLIGHNAPVTCLKLDPMCKVLMSTDKEGRDNAIRLWELHTGKSLAVFKPPGPISACEILPNCTYIVLALSNHSELLTLALNNYALESTPDDNLYVQYGDQDNQNKVFQLNLE